MSLTARLSVYRLSVVYMVSRCAAVIAIALGGNAFASDGYVRLESVWKSDQQINIETGTPASSATQSGWQSADWTLEPAESGFVRLKNRWKQTYLHVQNGRLEVGPIQPGWYSAMWVQEPMPGGVVRFKNRWKGTYLNIESGALQATAIQPGWLSAQWRVKRHTTRVVLMTPSDRQVSERYRSAVDKGVKLAQKWYEEQLGGKTFVWQTGVELCNANQPNAHFATDPWPKVEDQLRRCFSGFRKDSTMWIVYADVRPACDSGRLRIGAGSGDLGLTIMPEQDLRGLAGEEKTKTDCNEEQTHPYGRWIGGMIHEVGHALKLPHPYGCENKPQLAECDTNSVMWLGYLSYPQTYFSEKEKSALRRSKFIYGRAN
jgi:hypothetical protein